MSSSTARLNRTAALSLVLALVAASAPAADSFGERLESARVMAGSDPHRARAELAALRLEATKSNRAVWRLGVDEVDCRILSDIDEKLAVTIAEEGLRAVAPSMSDAARLPALRLRACHAGALISTGNAEAGERELSDLLAQSQSSDMTHARGLALLESGIHHSRSGAFLHAQDELLMACELMKTNGFTHDLELCRGHLANHYKRVGDLDEALRLLTYLRADAIARGAVWDDCIYAQGVAQVHFSQGHWSSAIVAFRDVIALSRRIGDRTGEAYAEHGMASSLLHANRAGEGLAHIERALEMLAAMDDHMQVLRSTIVQARLLTAVGRTSEAASELQRIQAKVFAQNQDLLNSDWWEASALAHGGLGRWRDAYEALKTWKEIDRRVQEQRKSEQGARLRTMFNRAQDIEALDALKKLNEQGRSLRQAQAAALVLFLLLLAIAVTYAVKKVREARRLRMLALTDELTGLPNRRAVIAYAEDLMNQVRSRDGRLSVLMIDVDRFKQVNDTHGHAVGDEVLRHLAQMLPTGLRSRDRLGRLGGEEFVVILPDATVDQAVQVAERMREAIQNTAARTSAGELRLTISIGVSQTLGPRDSIISLLDRADRALYKAKECGRNAVMVDKVLPVNEDPALPPPLRNTATSADATTQPVPGTAQCTPPLT